MNPHNGDYMEKGFIEKTINQTIKEFEVKYDWHIECNLEKQGATSVTDAINSGLCDLFAEAMKRKIPQATILYDEDVDHEFLKIGNRFYDAENPKGSDSVGCMVINGKVHKTRCFKDLSI